MSKVAIFLGDKKIGECESCEIDSNSFQSPIIGHHYARMTLLSKEPNVFSNGETEIETKETIPDWFIIGNTYTIHHEFNEVNITPFQP